MITLNLPLPPSANRYWRLFRGRTVKSWEATAYQEQAGWLAKAAGLRDPFTGPVAVIVRVYRQRRSGDLDNKLKCLFDSMNGIAWADDSQIVEIHAYMSDDKTNPRVEIEIAEAL
jgi:crossover junction endodeoxyribonuclease RusA